MTPHDQARAVLEHVQKELPDAWLGGRQRQVLEEAIARALRDTEQRVWEEMRARKDKAYLERNHLVAVLAHLFPSGIRKTNIKDWDDEWHGCVYIDLPSGQISYHYHDSHAHLFSNLPSYQQEYDGHTKDTVHQRLSEFRHQAQG